MQKESSKIIFLLGDFDIDLLDYEISDSINNFIDTLSSNDFSPLLLPTKISKTLTLDDNIFSNSTSSEEIELFLNHQFFLVKIPVIK